MQFFINQGYACAGAKVVALPCGIVLIITTLGDCSVARTVFESAYADLKTRPNFSAVFDPNSNVLDYDPELGVSTLKLLFN